MTDRMQLVATRPPPRRACSRACVRRGSGGTGWFGLLASMGKSTGANLALVFLMERHVRCRRHNVLDQGTEEMDCAHTAPCAHVPETRRRTILPVSSTISGEDLFRRRPPNASTSWMRHHVVGCLDIQFSMIPRSGPVTTGIEPPRFPSKDIEISEGRDRDFEGKGSRFRERSEGTEGNEGEGETWSGIGRVRRKRWASKRRRRRAPSSAKGRAGGGGGRSVQLWWRGRGHNVGNGKEHPPKRTGSVQLVPGRHSDASRKVWLGNLVCQALQKDPRLRG